jgi:hypothetical protein
MSDPAMEKSRTIAEAARTGVPIRLHIADGEVLVARILRQDPDQLVYVVVTSSRPEKYAVCDSTGFVVPLREIDRVQLV